MNMIYKLEKELGQFSSEWKLKDCRKIYGFSVVQAAAALNVSPATYERMEQEVIAPPTQEWTEGQFDVFLDREDVTATGNYVLNAFPLRVAREVIGLSVEQMADMFHYQPSTWRKFEANARKLKPETLGEVGQMVRDRFDSVCS